MLLTEDRGITPMLASLDRMKKHRDHIPFFWHELQCVSETPITLSFAEALEAILHDGLPETDAACRDFSQTLEWPTLSERVRFEVCLRLECAHWYCTELSELAAEDEEWSGSNFLEELLIAYWREGGRRDWLAACFGSTAGERLHPFPSSLGYCLLP